MSRTTEHSVSRGPKLSKRRVDGILLLDKPAGPSSNQALQTAKRALRASKAGHTGTLDPFATGLLPLMFGEATKFASFLLDAYKVYDATLLLGVTTSTGDITGEVLQRRTASVDTDEVSRVASKFIGEGMQVPPMYSALKRDGVPLYSLARRGEFVEREARRIDIANLSVLSVSDARVELRVRCSKGTYIRVLGEDIGRALGCGATVERLRRVEVASFDVASSIPLERVSNSMPEELDSLLLPVDAGLHHLPKIVVDASDAARLQLGQSVASPPVVIEDGMLGRVYCIEKMDFIGLVKLSAGAVWPVRMVVPATAKMA